MNTPYIVYIYIYITNVNIINNFLHNREIHKSYVHISIHLPKQIASFILFPYLFPS